MRRSETFFDAAVRKVVEETSDKENFAAQSSKVKPIAVVGVWNTFFPDSAWDSDRAPGRNGTQTVNIVVLCDLDGDICKIDEAAKKHFAVEKHRWVSPTEAVADGSFDKYVRLNVEAAQQQGLL